MSLLSIVTALSGVPRKKKKKLKKQMKRENAPVVVGVEITMEQATNFVVGNEAQYVGGMQYKPKFFTLLQGNNVVGVIGIANPRGRNTLAWMNLRGKDQSNAGEIVLLNVDKKYEEQVSQSMEAILTTLAQKLALKAIVWLPLLNETPTKLLTYHMKYYGESSPRSDFYKVVGDDGEYKRNPRGKTEGVAGVWLPRVPLYRFANVYTTDHQVNKEGRQVSDKRPLTISDGGLHALQHYKEVNTSLVLDKRTGNYYTNPRTTGELTLVKDVHTDSRVAEEDK